MTDQKQSNDSSKGERPCLHCTVMNAVLEWVGAGHGSVDEARASVAAALTDTLAAEPDPLRRVLCTLAIIDGLAHGVTKRAISADAAEGRHVHKPGHA